VAFRLFCSIGVGLAVVLGLDPFQSVVAGTLGAVSLIALSEDLADASWKNIAGWSVFISVCVGLLAFQWVAVALVNITQLSWPVALALCVVHAILFNLKIPFFLLAAHYVRRVAGGSLILVYPIFALAGDLLSFQIFPWFWGNLQGGNLPLIQSSRLFGVYAVSFLLFLQAGIVIAIFRILRERFRNKKKRNGFAFLLCRKFTVARRIFVRAPSHERRARRNEKGDHRIYPAGDKTRAQQISR